MGGFFNMDSAFYRFGSLLADVLILSVLWLVCSLPLITIGASTTAVFYVTTRRISDKEKSIIKDFFSSFKRNFKTATLVFLTLAVLIGLLIFNIYFANTTGEMSFFIPVYYCLALELIFISVFIFPVLSRFDMKYVQLFKTAFFMANRHMLTTVICTAVLVGVIFLSILIGPFFLVAAGVYCLATSYLFMRRFKKYRPEMDAEEDYEAIRLKLMENAGRQDEEVIFNDAAGLLIEKQGIEANKKDSFVKNTNNKKGRYSRK